MSTISPDSPSFTAVDKLFSAEKESPYDLALKILAGPTPFDALVPLTREIQADGRTILHIAAERGPSILVQELLKAGADSSPQDSFGLTPLHLAVLRDNETITNILLLAGAKTDAKDKKCHPLLCTWQL